MNHDDKSANQKLDALFSSLADDLAKESDETLIEEAIEEFGNLDGFVNQSKSIIDAAIIEHGKRRMAIARETYESLSADQSKKVIDLPLDRKRQLVKSFSESEANLDAPSTMAARSASNLEKDIDNILEDLIDLGFIDEYGNPL